jgi:hypothetical protein
MLRDPSEDTMSHVRFILYDVRHIARALIITGTWRSHIHNFFFPGASDLFSNALAFEFTAKNFRNSKCPSLATVR